MEQKRSTKFRLAITALVVLFGPAIFYYVLTRGQNSYKKLEVFGPKSFNGVASDTIYHTVGDFMLTDQLGEAVTQATFSNKIYVADFFFTSCTTICPKMSEGIQDVAYAFKDDSTVKFISHSVKPEEDSVAALLAYSKIYRAKPNKWYFVTGDKNQIYKLAREDYFLPVLNTDGSEKELVHSEKLVLIDTKKRIRGIYDGTDAWEIARLKDEIKVLEYECFGKVIR
jgi:protein SCO1/2